MDLAEGHVATLRYLENTSSTTSSDIKQSGAGKLSIFNLGTGVGYSVLDMVHTMSKACGHDVAYEFAPRRPGDVAENYADPTLATQELGWKATRNLEDICKDLWTWQSANPNGYQQ